MPTRQIFILFLLSLFITGCAHLGTKPNPTYLLHVPTISQFLPPEERKETRGIQTDNDKKAHPIFEKLFQIDRELAVEMGRIPEFQDGISDRELAGLGNFIGFLSSLTEIQKRPLKEILGVGKPSHRKYCSPLQALFWLAERNELNQGNNPLENYSLKKLLDQAWTFEIEFTKEEAEGIISNLKNKERAEERLRWCGGDTRKLNSVANVYLGLPEEIRNDFLRIRTFIPDTKG